MPLICPSDWLDSDAITLALSRLPSRLEREYQGKLDRREFGTILELALLGRLLQKSGSFAVSPWPESSRVDAHLTIQDRTLELEIKSSIKTLYDENVEKMCQLVGEHAKERWPGFSGEVNLFNAFREKEEGGHSTLDVEATAEDVMRELEKAVSPSGEVTPEYREFVPFRLVTKVVPSDHLLVWPSSSALPGGHGQNVIRRKLRGALEQKSQFSGENPALLALIQARDPDPRLVYQWEPSPAEESFARHPYLSAIIATPCPSLNGPPVVITPGEGQLPVRAHPLSGEDVQALAECFAVRLQVHPFWDGVERRLIDHLERQQRKELGGMVT